MKRILLSILLCPAFVLAQQSGKASLDQIDEMILNLKFTEALEVIDASAATQRSVEHLVLLDNKRAEALIRLGRFGEAEKSLTAAEEKNSVGNLFLAAITDSNTGILKLNQGRSDLAEELLVRSIGRFEQANKSGELEAAQALANLGIVYMSRGKYTQATEQLLQSLSIREAKLKGNHELIAATYNDLGLAFLKIDPNKSLDYYGMAMAVYEKLHGSSHSKIAIANTNMGIAYRETELYGDATNHFEAALKIWDKVYPQAHPAKAITLFNLGQTYVKTKNNKAAMGYYERSLKMYEEVYGRKHPELGNVLNAIGNVQSAEGEFDLSLRTYQKALKANVENFNQDDILINPVLKNYYHGTQLLYTLTFKAQAFEKRYLQKTLKFSDLEYSLKTLQSCDSLIDILRQQSSNENDKLQLGVLANSVYSDGVRIAFEAGTNAFSKKKYFEASFYFAEKSKSAVLLEAIADANAKSFSGIPDNLLEEERSLKSAIALTAQKLAQKPSTDEEKYLRETSFTLKRTYDAFIKQLEEKFPDYFNLKFNPSSPSTKDIQKLLDQHTAVLSYFIDEKNNTLYIFSITAGKFEITDHVFEPRELDKYITGFRNGIYFSDIRTYQLSARELSRLLIPRLSGSIRSLVILPTGRLGIIPFEALLTKETASKDFKTLPYLINRFAVRYEFSAALVLQKSKKSVTQDKPSIFLCAPVNFTTAQLNDLPGTEREVKDIAQLFASRNLKGDYFIQQQAGEQLVKSDKLRNYNLLHFATHGVVDENNPELSRVFLQADTEAEDGNLFAGEIYNLQLKADLVTLSACQTGLGKISKGEGVIGLSRALVYAGAKNIVVSFWSVADESTAELMKGFYQQLLNDSTSNNFNENLRNAKRGLIGSDNYAAPYYWAPFILIGF